MSKRIRILVLCLLIYMTLNFMFWSRAQLFCTTKSYSDVKKSKNLPNFYDDFSLYFATQRSLQKKQPHQIISMPMLTNLSVSKAFRNEDNYIPCFPHKMKNVDCKCLFRGDPEYIKTIRTMKDKGIYNNHNNDGRCALNELVKNCTEFQQFHGYFNKPITKTERDFPLAFAIKLHKSPLQFERLLRSIYRENNFYCIHVDAKADNSMYNLVKNITACLPNVVLTDKRINVVYATFRHIEAEIECMRACIRSKVLWRYYINLTGEEFLLKTNLELVEILKIFNGTNDVEAYKHPVPLNWRVKKKILIGEKNLVKTNNDKPPLKYKFDLYKGSAYGMFVRDFVEFVLNDNIVAEFLDWFKDTYSPEENIWSTLNSLEFAPGGYYNDGTTKTNVEFKYEEIRHDSYTHASKAVIWSWDKFKCLGKTVRGVCIYSVADLPWLKTRPEITANKFYDDYDSVALDCLEEALWNRTHKQDLQNLNWYYYRNLPHVLFNTKQNLNKRTKEILKLKKSNWLAKQHKYIKSEMINVNNAKAKVVVANMTSNSSKAQILVVLGPKDRKDLKVSIKPKQKEPIENGMAKKKTMLMAKNLTGDGGVNGSIIDRSGIKSGPK